MRYSRFSFVEDTISNSPYVPRAKFLGIDWLFCFISICNFASFKYPFAMITSLSELCFWFRRFTLLVQTIKVIPMSYGSSTSSWKPGRWVRIELLFRMRVIYISSNLKPLTKLMEMHRLWSSRRVPFESLATAEAYQVARIHLRWRVLQ